MRENDIFSMQGMNAIVTGGGRGIGKTLAEAYLQYGARVIITGSGDSIFETEKEFKAIGYDIHAVRMNLLDRGQRKEAFQECVDYFDGKLNVLLNNAGIQRRIPIEEWPLEEWDDVLEVNTTAVFDLGRMAAVAMKPNRFGKIINISSIAAYACTVHNIPAYMASKAAVGQLTLCFASEFGEYNICTNAIAPGFTLTALNKAHLDNPDKVREIETKVPLKRWGTTDDLKGAAVLLASHAGDYINGHTIVVDGGFLAR